MRLLTQVYGSYMRLCSSMYRRQYGSYEPTLFPVSVLPVRSSLLTYSWKPLGTPGTAHSWMGVGCCANWGRGIRDGVQYHRWEREWNSLQESVNELSARAKIFTAKKKTKISSSPLRG